MLGVWRIVARRSLANRRLLAVLALGVLVAATLLAAAPVYSRAMADLGLTFTIRDELRGAQSTRVQFPDIALDTAEGTATREAIERRIDERTGWFAADTHRYLRAGRFAAVRAGTDFDPRAPLFQVQSFTGWEQHVRIVSGRMPNATTDPNAPLEIVLGARASQISGQGPGVNLTLYEDFDTCEREIPRDDRPPPPPCTPRAGVMLAIPAVVTGVIEPLDPEDPFWVTGVNSFFDPVRLIPDAGPVTPVFADEGSLFGTIAARFPGYRAYTAWHIVADPEKLSRANYQRAADDIQALGREVEPWGGVAYSPLTSTLQGFGRSADYQQAPLMVLLLEIAGIALFYVALVSAVIVERQAGEIALLRGRGASLFQITGVYIVEGLLVGVPALLLAPFLAGAATSLLGLTPVFNDVSGGDLLPVTIPFLAFPMAALGVLLAVVALALPAFLVARRGAVAHRRAESRPGPSILQRYYLDLALVAFAGLILWELRERGSIFTPSATGGVSHDPLLLASPALVIAAAAALFLRLYPFILKVANGLLGRGAGVTVATGLAQVTRNPGQYTRLALLLMMAVAVGTFAASYSSTAERAYRDRAAYQTGVDLRALANGDHAFTGSATEMDTAAADLPGVTEATSVLRTTGGLATPGSAGRELEVLALDPSVAAGLLWFRDDFASLPLPELLGLIETNRDLRGKVLPDGATHLSVWVNPVDGRDGVTLWARVRGSNGRHDLLEFGKLTTPGWSQMRAQINAPYGAQLEPPFTLVSLVLTEGGGLTSTNATPVYLDDLAAVGSNGAETVLEDFEGQVVWDVLPSRVAIQDAFTVSGEQVHGGRSAGRFAFRTGTTTGVRGIYIKDPAVPVPALVSSAFQQSTGLGTGATTLLNVGDTLVPVSIKGVYNLFPTLGQSSSLTVILPRDLLISWANAFVDSGVRRPTELWMGLEEGADTEALAAVLAGSDWRLGNLVDQREALASVRGNPLVAAGGSGILFLAFLATLMLVAAAMLLSLWMAVERRRLEFAVLRALGVSRGQVFRVLLLEYSLVAVAGLAVGAYLGLTVGRQMLSFLNVTETGARVTPGFVLTTDWAYVAAGAIGVIAVLAVALVLAVRVLARISDAQALRG